jgi:hypothetical protein
MKISLELLSMLNLAVIKSSLNTIVHIGDFELENKGSQKRTVTETNLLSTANQIRPVQNFLRKISPAG